MRRILVSILTICAVMGFVSHGIWAYDFGVTGVNTGNSVDISVDGQSPWSNSYAVGSSDSGYAKYANLTIENIGNSPADIYLKLYNVVDSDVVRSESESKTEDSDGEKHDISTKVGIGIDGNYKGTLADVAEKSISIGKINIGETVYMSISFLLDENTGNEYQGDQSRFDISVFAVQSPEEPTVGIARVGGSSDGTYPVITPKKHDNGVIMVDSDAVPIILTDVSTLKSVELPTIPEESHRNNFWLLALIIGFATFVAYMIYKRRQK